MVFFELKMVSEAFVFWFVVLVGVLLTGISKSGFAGSIGVVAVPLMSLVMPIEQAAALMLPVLILMDTKVIHYYYKYVNWSVLVDVLPAALAGIMAATWLMGQVPSKWLQVFLGVICVIFSCWHRLNAALGRLRGAGLLWGSLSGFTSTLIHAGGPPINIYFAGKQLPKIEWLACAGVFFGIINLVKVGPYLYLGLWSKPLLIKALLVLPVAWLGVWLGKALQGCFTEQRFLLLSRVLVFSSGILLFYKALG